MGADRDGNRGSDWNNLHPLTSTAPTRHTSPAPSQRSTLHPTSNEQADEDLARALAASTGDLRQETGVVGPGGNQVFGPANRDHYAENQWGMVRAGPVSNGTEIIPDVVFEQRSLKAGEPSMLKPSPDSEYLPNLLTVCAAIEGARKTLLVRGHVQADYGQDKDWWRGHAIARPKIVHIADGSAVDSTEDVQRDELLSEVQRLMAFLTATTRSYGSVGALLDTDIMKRTGVSTTRSNTSMELFIEQWSASAISLALPDEYPGALFISTTYSPEGMDTPRLGLIDTDVTLPEGEKKELGQLLDDFLWGTDGDTENFVETPAEVLVMRVRQTNKDLGNQLRVEAPAELYIDKYLKSNIAATSGTRRDRARASKRIAKIEEVEKKLQYWKHPRTNGQIDAGIMLKHTLGHFNGQNKVNAAKMDRNYVEMEEDETASLPSHYRDVTQQLDQIIGNIEDKLQRLNEEKEKARTTLREISRSTTAGLDPDELKHRYTLRGVSTDPSVTYLLCPIDNSDDNVDDPFVDEDTTPTGMRWMRIEYKYNGDVATLSKEKVGDYDVLRAVELESGSALLVYASDAITAVSEQPQSLPQPLQDFVDRDNEASAQELSQPQYAPPSGPPPNYGPSSFDLTDVPRESIERTSLDSTRAEADVDLDLDHGGLPPYEGEGFYAHQGYGLPPDSKQEDEPVHEIHLDREEEGNGIEMVEKMDDSNIMRTRPASERRNLDEEW